MKGVLFKDSLREIVKSYRRFVSILMMSLLGVGFFAGIRATSIDMNATLNDYYKQSNVYDIKIMSTLGLTDDDVVRLQELGKDNEVEAGFAKDVLLKAGGNTYVARAVVYNDRMNLPMTDKSLINYGILPPKDIQLQDNWCLVDSSVAKKTDRQLGDMIELAEMEAEPENEVLKRTQFRIIGFVNSPEYMGADRGVSTLGSGKTDFFVYIPGSAVDADYYTELNIRLSSTKSQSIGSIAYKKEVAAFSDLIGEIKADAEQSRYDKLYTEAKTKIDDAELKLNHKTKEAQEKIDAAKSDIEAAKLKIKNAESDIEDAKTRISDGNTKLNKERESGYQKIRDGEKSIKDARTELKEQLSELSFKKQELQDKELQISQGYEEIEAAKEQLRAAGMPDEGIELQLSEKLKELEAASEAVKKGMADIADAENRLAEAWRKLSDKELEIAESKLRLERELKKAEQELTEAQAELEAGEKELSENKLKLTEADEKLVKNEAEFIEKTNEAKEKLADAKRKLNDLKYPKWHILDREDNTGYDGFLRDIDSVARLGSLFPIILFLISALISLNSMTRMVEEQRVEIGTLKAMGYSNFAIASKYLGYAFAASFLGGMAGMLIGFNLIPELIWSMYATNYSIPIEFKELFDYQNGGVGLLLSTACILAATLGSLLKELMEVPSQLMRPKAPKIGKRVLLERITPLWSAMSFSQKVTLRNLFRYKKRFLMTIIGVMGCTSLILSGFGLRESVSYLVDGQYGSIFSFDMMIRLSDGLSSMEKSKTVSGISQLPGTDKAASISMSAMKVKGGRDKAYDCQLIVAEDKEKLKELITLKDLQSGKPTEVNPDGIYITDKLAELIGVGSGSNIKVIDENDKTLEASVTAVVENYLAHYIYMDRALYERLIAPYSTNTVLLKNNDGLDEEAISQSIIALDNVDAVILSSSVTERMSGTMKSLNYVVAVLIIAAALLDFVVLFNLASLNISERRRELATIKVLGFYDKEVYDYLDRETIILSVIGVGLGMVGGYLLNTLIVKTCEVDYLRFNTSIGPLSFVFAALIAFAFSLLVNIITYFSLKKVDMVESLKSVE